jgi:hypothetical protein
VGVRVAVGGVPVVVGVGVVPEPEVGVMVGVRVLVGVTLARASPTSLRRASVVYGLRE